MKWLNKCGSAVLLLMIACNQAPIGFQAPSGSTVAVSSITTAPGAQDTYLVLTVSVSVPAVDDTVVPGNNIFVTATCSKCTIYDRAAGESSTVADPTRVGEVTNPYSFATNSSGNYQIVIKVEDPADLGVASYKASIIVDIGVASAQQSITVGG